jgi:hypothetical protein
LRGDDKSSGVFAALRRITGDRKQEEGLMRGVDMGIAGRVYEKVRWVRPRGRVWLRNYVKVFLGADVPDVRICEGHCTPMDYLWHAWSVDSGDGGGKGLRSSDAVVWANRGGGKTHLGAVASLLDCMFKPGCSVRILGGSREQSSRMYDYLTGFVNSGYKDFVDGYVLKGRCRFVNGSDVEIMSQSESNVRGRHVNKLRCDEVELFDERVYEAAKFITKSTEGIRGTMESISTMHRPWGLMRKVLGDAEEHKAPVFKWCMLEVMERCRERSCSRCVLWSDCGGHAKDARGYLRIDDCIEQMRRSSRAGFESEMLCRTPSLDDAVFSDFDEKRHVGDWDYDASLPLYRTIDFGYVNPFVCLWIQVDADGVVRVIDEYVRRRATIDVHAEAIRARTPCAEEKVAGTFCDPSGAATGGITGTSIVGELSDAGIRVRYKHSGILEGIELVRRAIMSGDGASRFAVSRRCRGLIESLKCYHYPQRVGKSGAGELPQKDGVHDHAIDALRYFFVNYREKDESGLVRY